MIAVRTTAMLLALLVLFGCTNDPSPTSPTSEAMIGSISVSVDPAILDQSDPQAHSTVTATCLDKDGQPVPAGQRVSFKATLGSIAASAVTDANGVATATLLARGASGKAEITAIGSGPEGPVEGGAHIDLVDPAVLVSFEVNCAPSVISVHGVGGVETAVITVRALNGMGEVVTQEVQVTADLVNESDPPVGCMLDGEDGAAQTTTQNGVVRFGLNAGTQSHPPLVRISAGNVAATVSPATVVGGPAFQLSIDVDNWGWDAGGGSWAIGVSAQVWDVHRNPVRDGTPVSFTVDPQIAMISAVSTGNRNHDGRSVPGVAATTLIYQSINTFDPISISAEVSTADGVISTERETVLPLQKGYMRLHVDPDNWMFDRQRENDTCLIRAYAVVKDGHDVEINNAPVLFGVDRARLYWKNLRLNGRYVPFFPEVVRRYTGLINQENNEPRGTATVYLRGTMSDFYLDDFTLTLATTITAEVEGYGYITAEPQQITINRH